MTSPSDFSAERQNTLRVNNIGHLGLDLLLRFKVDSSTQISPSPLDLEETLV